MQTDSKEQLREAHGFLSLNKDALCRASGRWQSGPLSWHRGCFSEDVFQVFNQDASELLGTELFIPGRVHAAPEGRRQGLSGSTPWLNQALRSSSV